MPSKRQFQVLPPEEDAGDSMNEDEDDDEDNNDKNKMDTSKTSSSSSSSSSTSSSSSSKKLKLKSKQKQAESMYTPAIELKHGYVRELHGNHRSQKVTLVPHPTTIVEPSALVAAGRPTLKYKPMLPRCVFESGKLSSAQYTSISLAGQAMSKVLLDTEDKVIYRKGYVIGDGTGIGKGRQIAAIIADNFFQGRTRSCWVSCSRSLLQDAIRDFRDLGLAIPVSIYTFLFHLPPSNLFDCNCLVLLYSKTSQTSLF